MLNSEFATARVGKSNSRISKWLKLAIKQKYLVLMSFPFVIWLIIFSYIPLWGWTMAFQDYKPGLPFQEQEWIGLKYFIIMFKDPDFYNSLRNTLVMSSLSFVVGFTFPVILALLLNEIMNERFRRSIQTISYLPHFVSWVVVAGIAKEMLSLDGPINFILVNLGIVNEPVLLLAKPELFWINLTTIGLWKEIGWSSIIFFAAISGIPQEHYEAATMDGAGRFKRMWHITLPGIMPTVTVMMIMSLGGILNTGFEAQLLMRNDLVRDVSDTLDLYVLNAGINSGRFAFGTAVGMAKSVVSVILVFGANILSGKISEYRIV